MFVKLTIHRPLIYLFLYRPPLFLEKLLLFLERLPRFPEKSRLFLDKLPLFPGKSPPFPERSLLFQERQSSFPLQQVSHFTLKVFRKLTSFSHDHIHNCSSRRNHHSNTWRHYSSNHASRTYQYFDNHDHRTRNYSYNPRGSRLPSSNQHCACCPARHRTRRTLGLFTRLRLQCPQTRWLPTVFRSACRRLSVRRQILCSRPTVQRSRLATRRYIILPTSTKRILQSQPQSVRIRLHNLHQNGYRDIHHYPR